MIFADGERRGRAPVRPADRRGIVAVAERDPVGDELGGLRAHDRLAHGAARLRARGGVERDLGMRALRPVGVVGHAGMADIAHAHRMALDLVGIHEASAAPARQHGGELPGQIDRIAETGIEPEPGGRMIEMGGVAGEKDPLRPVAVGHHVAGAPAADREHLVRHRLADHLLEQAVGIHRLGRIEIRLAADPETVQLATVQDHQIAPQPGRLDEADQRGLAHGMVLPQARRPHEDAQVVSHIGRAAHADAQGPADRAVPAAAVDDILGHDLDALVARQIICQILGGDDDAVALLPQGFEPAAVAQLHAGLGQGEIAQDRIEPELVAALRPLRALRGGAAAAVMGALDAGDLEAVEAGAVERRVREILRRRGRPHRLGHAEPAHELHGARIEGGGARMVGRSLALLDDQAGHAALAEVGRQRQADRAGADDQDRDFGDAGLRCHSGRWVLCGEADAGGRRRARPGPAYSCIRAPGQGLNGSLAGKPAGRNAPAWSQKKAPPIGGARLTAWRFPKEGRPVFTQSL